MSTPIPIFSAICLILLQIILISIASGGISTQRNNASHHASPRKSDRFKRSPPKLIPDRLKIKMKHRTELKVDLKWIKKIPYLANQYLPVVTSSDYSNSNVMKDVGEFHMFQDVEKCSAVVYFKKYNNVFGVLGLHYAITNLPNKFDAHGIYPGEVSEPYISRRADLPIHNDPLLFGSNAPPGRTGLSTCSAVRGVKRPLDSHPGPSDKHQRTEREIDGKDYGKLIQANESRIRNRREAAGRDGYYLEILVFVTIDIVDFFKQMYGVNYFEWIVRYYILYFNAVDMVFKHLPNDFVLRINIAKIVIEDSLNRFNFANDEELQFANTIVKLREYLKINQHIHLQDSYDHVFISTNRPIWDNSILVAGTRDIGMGFYDARERDEFYKGVPITIVGLAYDYIIAVHEISRTLNIESDSWVDGLIPEGQCNSIMQEGSSKCIKCFKWSEDTKKQFQTFFKTNKNRCGLMNEPRSVRPPEVSRFVSPIRQCQCLGYHSHFQAIGKSRAYVREYMCNVALRCGKMVGREMSYEYTLRPFDGTNCGALKVCWNRECVPVKSESRMQNDNCPTI